MYNIDNKNKHLAIHKKGKNIISRELTSTKKQKVNQLICCLRVNIHSEDIKKSVKTTIRRYKE